MKSRARAGQVRAPNIAASGEGNRPAPRRRQRSEAKSHADVGNQTLQQRYRSRQDNPIARVQASFGPYDLTSVQTRTGTALPHTTGRPNANAVTRDERIHFKRAPDLRLAAHEAAHVIQQRSGHASGLDNGGKRARLELHADRVADAVVRRCSAAPILAELGPARRWPTGRAGEAQFNEPAAGAEALGSAGAMSAEALAAHLAARGFTAAGPNAIGIVAYPRVSLRAPIPQTASVWGHTALYVRYNGRIVIVRGFNINRLLDLVRPASAEGGILSRLVASIRHPAAVRGGTASVPAAISEDAGMFRHTGARAMEYPVTPEVAEGTIRSMPEAGPAEGRPGLPPRYTASPRPFGNPCVGSNCGLWATRAVERLLGGLVGTEATGESVADVGRGNVPRPNSALQGKVIDLINRIMRGEPAMSTARGGVPVASHMPWTSSAKMWGSRGLMALAPALEFYMNVKQDIPWMQNLMRTGTVGSGVLAFPGLYGGGSPVHGLKSGPKGAGWADLVINLVNAGVHLAGAPEEVAAMTETAATLTPSHTMFTGAKGAADFVYTGIAEGAPGLERTHEGMRRGSHGGMMQGYSLFGALLAGENLDFLASDAAARGDYGTFVEAGNYWGDVAFGDRSLTEDLGEIWDFITD